MCHLPIRFTFGYVLTWIHLLSSAESSGKPDASSKCEQYSLYIVEALASPSVDTGDIANVTLNGIFHNIGKRCVFSCMSVYYKCLQEENI